MDYVSVLGPPFNATDEEITALYAIQMADGLLYNKSRLQHLKTYLQVSIPDKCPIIAIIIHYLHVLIVTL